jgi:hypothetical protein
MGKFTAVMLACFMLLLLGTPAYPGEEEKMVPATAKEYFDRMQARCGDSTFVKQDNYIWELKGKVEVLCCHQPPEVLRNDPQGITWRGTIEVASPKDRIYTPHDGWSEWGDAFPLLFEVYKQKGQWKAKGLSKISCGEVPTFAPRVEDMTLDGMIFHGYDPPRTSKDNGIFQDWIQIDQYMKYGEYKAANQLIQKLLKKIRAESPTIKNPAGEKYSASLYQALKQWEKQIGGKKK